MKWWMPVDEECQRMDGDGGGCGDQQCLKKAVRRLDPCLIKTMESLGFQQTTIMSSLMSDLNTHRWQMATRGRRGRPYERLWTREQSADCSDELDVVGDQEKVVRTLPSPPRKRWQALGDNKYKDITSRGKPGRVLTKLRELDA